jgi:hypothetical protein
VLDVTSVPAEILPGDSIRLQGEAASGATIRVLVNDQVVASAIAGDSGRWRTTIGFAAPGDYTVTLQVVDETDTVLAAAEPVTLAVLEPTPAATETAVPTATPASVLPTATPVTEPAVAAPAEITTTVTISPAQPGALPGTGVALDRLGWYNVFIPLALILGLVAVTLFQRKRSDA